MNHWQGWLYVAAVLIPLAAFAVELIGIRVLRRLNALIATGAIATSFVLSAIGFVSYCALNPAMVGQGHEAAVEAKAHPGSEGHAPSSEEHHGGPLTFAGSFDWIALGAGLGGVGETGVNPSTIPRLVIPLGISIDNLAALMFVMVSFIATLIHIYSMGYMKDDPRHPLFFAYLSLFCFSMLGLVAASNLLMIFIFWELVGICSYLLIGFWWEEKKNVDAANKAFVVNRVGDIGMLIGLGLLWSGFGTFNFQEINHNLRNASGDLNTKTVLIADSVAAPQRFVALIDPDTDEPLLSPASGQPRQMGYGMLVLAGLGIFAGCAGKSAQFPLHVWLPDAMAGPTPVSALIHAATMVAAGVYLVGRFFPVFTPEVLLVIAYTGGITLFLAATIAMVQTDYKKVLAYSTISQLGFMILALGVGGWAAGLFHLFTHAFFKALLFLGAGSIYHAVHTYEMPVLGGLKRKMPITAVTMLVGTLAISGVPFFSGFYSKDAILASALFFTRAHPGHFLLFVLPSVGALITAFYMFRLYFLVFEGEPRGYPEGHDHGQGAHHHGNPYDHAHESPPIMTRPLILLAIPAVFVGWPITLGLPFFGYEPILEHMLAIGEPIRSVELGGAKWLAMGASILIATTGIAAAAIYYSPRKFLDPAVSAQRFGGIYQFFVHKWYLDELFEILFVQPILGMARFCALFDRRVLDGIVNGAAYLTKGASVLSGLFDQYIVDGLVNGTAWGTYLIGDWGRSIQTGRLRNYLMILAVGVILLFFGIVLWIRPALAG
ncbi:MAG: NADH-quinone oxidoreductase subunit L [Isosphaeraceae bacterium]